MSAELLPTGRDPLTRLWTMTLTTGVSGLAAIIYAMVKFARGQSGPDDWMFMALGASLLVVAVLSSIVQAVLRNYGARIEALEKQSAADVKRPGVVDTPRPGQVPRWIPVPELRSREEE